jgi:hypothetical protein
MSDTNGSSNGHVSGSAPPLSSVPAKTALDAHFLEARCRLLDLAAILDRISRGAGADALARDERLHRIRLAMEAILDPEPRRAEVVQKIFSLDYDPGWEVPQPRY